MIELINLKKEYAESTPIKCINATINQGDVISIIGPSGTGKSTLLRMINMLEEPTSGTIRIDGEDITTSKSLDNLRQKVGMVFQNYNLFNHMTSIENVCFGPIYVKGIAPSEAYEYGMKLLESVGLAKYAYSYPERLSGGQKQRVAIARALAMDPEITLLDEPTSALDPTMISEVQEAIKKMADEGRTMILVTHDMNFAERVSNRVFFLCDGEIYEEGTPQEVFHSPKREKTKEFILRLKDLHIEIDSPQYDYLSLYSAIDVFSIKNSVVQEVAEKLKAILEELCFGIIMPELRENFTERTRVIIDVAYSEFSKAATITVKWHHLEFNYEDSNYMLQRRLIRHYASSTIFEGENSILIMI